MMMMMVSVASGPRPRRVGVPLRSAVSGDPSMSSAFIKSGYSLSRHANN